MIAARTRLLIVAIAALVVIAAGVLLSLRHNVPARPSAERKVLYWYDPMQPEQHFDKPGKSPFMDMELVAKYADENGAAGVRIDAATQQHLAVRLASVELASLAGSVTAPGSIAFDERDLLVLQARASGFVQRVYVHAIGEAVPRNAPLVDLLIPGWTGVQQELIALKDSGDAQLLAAVRTRALALGMTAEQVAALEESGNTSPVFTLRAPQAGIVQRLDVREGMNIAAGASLLSLNGIERVWFDMAVPENMASAITLGQTIAIRLNTPIGEKLSGKIVALLPELNTATRSLRVRAELDNKKGALRIGQYAQATIAGNDSVPALTIPSEAVIRGGESNRVIVVQTDGSFVPQQIETGREANGRVEVLAGLSEGQRVVSSGQFLIDSEASLSGEMTRLAAPVTAPAPTTDQHDHGAHQHD
jgi:Cu(I)/Ag(I) efflux system membrane fusion protein